MRWTDGLALCLSLTWLPLPFGLAAELQPADAAPEQVIDHYIDAELQRAGVAPAPATDDVAFLRRVMLDLVGRPPTAAEARSFQADPSSDKRAQRVDQLLRSPGFIRQQAAEFDAWLMAGTRASLSEYLTKAFRENRTWDRMFRDMIAGEADDPRQQGAIRFVAARSKDADQLASDASVAFFGVNITCAKCHDHPLVSDWQQDHYYGMLSFFSRTFNVGDFLGEREYGQVTFKTVEGESREARPMFLSGKVVEEPPAPEPDEEAKKAEKKLLDELKKNKEPPALPSYSRRAVLVDTALQDEDHQFFARSIVNHMWNRFFGRGLVMPVDQMHSENPPSHPELLTWLARDLRSHSYDLTRLIRGMVLSRTYARSSRWDSAMKRPDDKLFAVALVRPLKPWQYATLLKLAATSPDELQLDGAPDDVERRLESLENSARGMAKDFDLPGEDFQVGVGEALLFSNGEAIASNLLADQPSTLVGRLGRCETPADVADLAIWNVFARPPEDGELEPLVEYLTSRADRPLDARRQLVWALLTSSECRFNY